MKRVRLKGLIKREWTADGRPLIPQYKDNGAEIELSEKESEVIKNALNIYRNYQRVDEKTSWHYGEKQKIINSLLGEGEEKPEMETVQAVHTSFKETDCITCKHGDFDHGQKCDFGLDMNDPNCPKYDRDEQTVIESKEILRELGDLDKWIDKKNIINSNIQFLEHLKGSNSTGNFDKLLNYLIGKEKE